MGQYTSVMRANTVSGSNPESCNSNIILAETPQWQERPYQDDSTASRPLSEVKHLRVRLVLRWGTTLESLMLFFLFRIKRFPLTVTTSKIRTSSLPPLLIDYGGGPCWNP